MPDRPRSDRLLRRPPGDGEERPSIPSNHSGRLVVTPQVLTWAQRLRKGWNDRVPRTQDVNTLFIPTGRHQVRLDWRHPLAIPFVVMIVVLSPLLLIVATLVWVADKVETIARTLKTKGSDRP